MRSFIVPHPVAEVYEVSKLDRALEGVPRAPGVYAFYARDLPDALAPFATAGRELNTLYVGQTNDDLSKRIEHHLFRDARVSTLRGSLGLLAQVAFELELIRIPGQRYFCFRDETPITEWLAQHALIGYSVQANPIASEAAWLAIQPGLLNLNGCPSTLLSEKIRLLRRDASGRWLSRPRR